jgi:hypothetical protein
LLGPTLTYPILLVISINANILKVDLGTKERAVSLMADMFIYLLKVAGAFSTTILGPSTNVSDIMSISRSGTTKWQRWGAPFVLALRGAVEQYLQIEDLLTRDDEYLMAYKDSYVHECNMIAVAVSSQLLYSPTAKTPGF